LISKAGCLFFTYDPRFSVPKQFGMAETTINVIDALRGQQEQLKRLITQKTWISDAPQATLAEIDAQLNELKRLIAQLETDIQDQLDSRK
jgi:hypothetical protein